MAVGFKPHIDAVPRGASHGAGDATLRLGKGIDERALAHVAPPHDCHLHFRQRRSRLLLRPGLGQPLRDRLDKEPPVAVLPHADDHRWPEAEGVKLVRQEIVFHVVGLVGHQQNRNIQPPYPLCHFEIGRQQAVAHLHHKHHQRRPRQPRLNLGIDLGGEAIGIVKPHPSGVDQIEDASLHLHPLDQSVARHARIGILDGDALLNEPVEQARLADVGASHHNNLGNNFRHDSHSIPVCRPAAGVAWHGQGSDG